MPTEKAHGMQIMQMCESFAQEGLDVTLIASRRFPGKHSPKTSDVWHYYNVQKIFKIERCPCIDLFPLGKQIDKVAFYLEVVSFTFFLMLIILFSRADIYFSRDPLTILLLSFFKPRSSLIYETHQRMEGRFARRIEGLCAQRAGLAIAVTQKMADDLSSRSGKSVLMLHGAFHMKRFSDLPDQKSARHQTNLPPESFIIGYVGQLQTMSLSKGVDSLIDAIAQIQETPVNLCLVGGPDDAADQMRQRWITLGLPVARFLYMGQVSPTMVPIYLSALDVCAMTFPATEHFRYYMSPLKMFEYMAAGRAIISTDFPSIADALHHEHNALLVPPDDVAAIAKAVQRLYDDPPLRVRLGKQACEDVKIYTWQNRARRILRALPLLQQVDPSTD
jgi:glycosyltransferase involved in cell wall biosynthesis